MLLSGTPGKESKKDGIWGLRYFKKQLYKTLVVTNRLVHLLSVSIPSRFTTPPSVLPLYLKYLPGILSEFYQCLEDIQYPKNTDRWD